MIQTNLLSHGHADLVTHVTYDFYGERLATCSADQRIKLFRRSNDGSWDLETEWKLKIQAHDAPILRLSFAHPLHGSLLASCSHDRTVRIWEEPSTSAGSSSSASTSTGNPAAAAVSQANKEGRWLEKGVLTGAKGSVRQVEFGPADPGLGLRVASIATDSHLRIHLSLDPSLTDWSLAHDIHVPSLPSPGSSEDLGQEVPAGPQSTAELATGGWGLSWCKEKWWGSVLACFAGTNPGVKFRGAINRMGTKGMFMTWLEQRTLTAPSNCRVDVIINLDPAPTTLLSLLPPSSSSPLTALSWAPSCGRSYHHLATGARDGTMRIWKVTPPDLDQMDEGAGAGGVARGTEAGWRGEIVAEFGRGARIGMVDWNATGTVLTTSDDDGMVRIYKQTYAKEWRLMGKMTAEEPGEAVNGHHS